MTVGLLLITCLLLSPWMVQFFRYVTTRPEAIPTPSWMVTTNVLFVFVMPLVSALVWGKNFASHERAASWIAFTSVAYWITFTTIYLLLSHGKRTVEPDGPLGCQSAFGVLKAAALSITPIGSLMVYLPLAVIRVFFIQVWGLSVSGGGMAMMSLPYFLVIVYLLLGAATAPFTIVFTCHIFGRTTFNGKLIAAGALVANFIFAALMGRRPVLMFAGFFALGMLWSGRRKRIVPLVGLGLAVWFLMTVFSPVFLQARSLWLSRNGPDAVTAFKIAIAEQRFSDTRENLTKQNAENIKSRLNSYAIWLELYDQFIDEPLGGLALTQAVIMNIPRFLIGLKKYEYGVTSEYLYGSGDISNNVSLESFLDLGMFGPFVHGAMVAVLFFAVDRINRRITVWNKYAALVAVGPMIECLVSPEFTLSGYGSTLRNTILIAVLAFLLTLVIGRRPVKVAPQLVPRRRYPARWQHSGVRVTAT